MGNVWIMPLLPSVSDINAPNNKMLPSYYLVKTVYVKKRDLYIEDTATVTF